MKISEFYKTNKTTYSFEFFPPKTDEGETKLFETVASLKSLNPSFVSVTYGAMGTTRENTLRIVSKIKNEIGIEAAAHLTCVGHTRHEIEKILGDLKQSNVENIVALRGDPPKGETEYKPLEEGFRYGSELVNFIRSHPKYSSHFNLAVAGYPEGHSECKDKGKDLEHLKIKVDAGADIIITQLFFDNADFFDFVNRARQSGINVPIVAGIMPVTNGSQIQRFTKMIGAKLPSNLQEAVTKYGDDQKSIEKFGIEYTTRQCEELLRNNVAGFHFYTLNKSLATRQICCELGLAKRGLNE